MQHDISYFTGNGYKRYRMAIITYYVYTILVYVSSIKPGGGVTRCSVASKVCVNTNLS